MAGVSRCKYSPRFVRRSAHDRIVERHFETLKESFPWQDVSKGKVIDVGGGSGHMSVSLARVGEHSLGLDDNADSMKGIPEPRAHCPRLTHDAVFGITERFL